MADSNNSGAGETSSRKRQAEGEPEATELRRGQQPGAERDGNLPDLTPGQPSQGLRFSSSDRHERPWIGSSMHGVGNGGSPAIHPLPHLMSSDGTQMFSSSVRANDRQAWMGIFDALGGRPGQTINTITWLSNVEAPQVQGYLIPVPSDIKRRGSQYVQAPWNVDLSAGASSMARPKLVAPIRPRTQASSESVPSGPQELSQEQGDERRQREDSRGRKVAEVTGQAQRAREAGVGETRKPGESGFTLAHTPFGSLPSPFRKLDDAYVVDDDDSVDGDKKSTDEEKEQEDYDSSD
ncbi:hypothetical protein NW752_005843 [Fusarium irregulare]|uniref:Uncharacterized protein n=1 Tax=Fusarium irregulare TaxID=2494466 RepID=A0A9W8PQE9_9HYPO|nr:hypothetical protein NW766_006376 [Fusarium irregulare]KAJ4018715.1 hypothetical protein NW752_005843 [Fusarium irregulare]